MLYIYLYIILSINIMMFISLILYCCHIGVNKTNFLTEQSLNKFLNLALKKRKSNENKLKYSTTNVKNNKYSYKYLFIKKININLSKIEYCKKTKNILWLENDVLSNRVKIKRVQTELGLHNFNFKYRAYNGKIIIAEIAKSYCFLSVTKPDFDCITHFRELVSSYKLFKKEIQILPVLVKYYFLLILKNNVDEIRKIRNKLLKNKQNVLNNKKINKNKVGVYAFFKYAERNIAYYANYVKKIDFSDCYELSMELLSLSLENQTILKWFDLL